LGLLLCPPLALTIMTIKGKMTIRRKMNRAQGWAIGFLISLGLWLLIIWVVMEAVEVIKLF
jgi:hypothetical protein